MKYYYEKPLEWDHVGKTYICDHPLYNRCTLFTMGDRGVAVIQEHYHSKTKARWWGTVDPWIASDIFRNKDMERYLGIHAKEPDQNGIYPTIKLRRLMWILRMKPLRKEIWEE